MAGYWKRLAAALGGRETRASYGPSFNYAGGVGFPGHDDYSKRETMSAARAESLATVLCCVNIIASTIASLPPRIYRVVNGNRIELSDSPYHQLLVNPYATATWADLVEFLLGNMLLHGNGLCQVVNDQRGVVTSLRPLPFERIVPLWRLKDPQDYRLLFNVMIPGVPMYQLLDNEVLLLRDRTDDGLLGRSRISRAAGAMVNAENLQRFSNAAWLNQATPSGVVTLPPKLTPDGFRRFKDQFKQKHAGTDNAREPIFLDNGANWTSAHISPEDQEVLNSRVFSVQEICRVFGVPPVMVAEWSRSTFTNSTEAGRWFIQYTLLPHIKKFEAEFKRAVFGLNSDLEIELDASGILRGDFATRWASYQIAIQNKVLTVDEIRAAEGYSPMAQSGTPVAQDDET